MSAIRTTACAAGMTLLGLSVAAVFAVWFVGGLSAVMWAGNLGPLWLLGAFLAWVSPVVFLMALGECARANSEGRGK